MHPAAAARIVTLQVRGARRDDPALRLALSSRLGASDFRPPGMPPAAILIVRRVTDPLPGGLPVKGSLHGHKNWEQAARNRLGELYRGAAPAHRLSGAETADAVVFADEAELLTCLALDLSRRVAGRRWWWRHFTGKLPAASDPSEAVRALLSENIRFLPAVLDRLADRNRAEPVLSVLSNAGAAQILALLAQTHSLNLIHEATDAFGKAAAVAAADRRLPQHHRGVERAPIDSAGGINPAPWRPWLGSAGPKTGFSPELSVLLGLGLMLYRRPRIARSADFQIRVAAWWNGGHRPTAGQPNPDHVGVKLSPTSEEKPPSTSAAGSGHIAGPAMPSGLPGNTDGRPASFPQDRQFKDEETRPEVRRPRADRPAITEVPPTGSSGPPTRTPPTAYRHGNIAVIAPRLPVDPPDGFSSGKLRTAESAAGISRADLEKDSDGEIADLPDAAPPGPAGVFTGWGGVLYLINLMVELKLPHCYENDWRLAGGLGPWGLLEMLGRALLTQRSPDVEHDPLWAVLAELDGRAAGERPGGGMVSCRAFRLPVDWFRQVHTPEDRFCWAARRRRLWLWSAAGHVLADVPRDERAPGRQAIAELSPYLDGESVARPLRGRFRQVPLDRSLRSRLRAYSPALRSWLSYTMPYIRYRLQLALSPEGGGWSAGAEPFLACPGRLYVTATHVDFVTAIDNISLPVRKAGLDRDPGWNPGLMRVVCFHFE